MMEDGKRIFITGVSQGIGRALMEYYARAGWQVWGTVRGNTQLDLSTMDVESRSRVTLLPLELTDLEACKSIKDAVNQPIDVLVNSAADFGNDAFYAQDLSAMAFVRTLTINVVAPSVIAQSLKPLLMKGSRKLIVMMSTGNASISGNTLGQMFSYRASKSALNQVTRSLAAEWAGEGFTAIALNPGWVQTKMGGINAPLRPEQAAENISRFIGDVRVQLFNGAYVNTDGSTIPF